MTGSILRLVLTVPARAGLDEVLVGLVTLVNEGPEPVTVNGRLTLAEGDLEITTAGPAGRSRAGWPWPADVGVRTVRLGAGQSLETGVLLLCTDGSRPLFPEAGRYELVASYPVGNFPAEEGGGSLGDVAQSDSLPSEGDSSWSGAPAGWVVTSEPAVVLRTDPAPDEARAARRALTERDVIQSIAAAGTLGTAGPALADLAARSSGPTALLAELAGGADMSSDLAGLDALTAATSLTAVMLPGDARREGVASSLGLDEAPRTKAMIRAEPTD